MDPRVQARSRVLGRERPGPAPLSVVLTACPAQGLRPGGGGRAQEPTASRTQHPPEEGLAGSGVLSPPRPQALPGPARERRRGQSGRTREPPGSAPGPRPRGPALSPEQRRRQRPGARPPEGRSGGRGTPARGVGGARAPDAATQTDSNSRPVPGARGSRPGDGQRPARAPHGTASQPSRPREAALPAPRPPPQVGAGEFSTGTSGVGAAGRSPRPVPETLRSRRLHPSAAQGAAAGTGAGDASPGRSPVRCVYKIGH